MTRNTAINFDQFLLEAFHITTTVQDALSNLSSGAILMYNHEVHIVIQDEKVYNLESGEESNLSDLDDYDDLIDIYSVQDFITFIDDTELLLIDNATVIDLDALEVE